MRRKKSTISCDTLCSEKDKVVLEKMDFPDPVISVTVKPKTKADQEKMGFALGKLAAEDPSFHIITDEESSQVIISGMGELHLEILVDRMKREFKVEAEVGAPQVAYRETIRSAVNKEYKYTKQSGGRGQFGHVFLKIEPQEPGFGYEFVDEIKSGVVPTKFIQPVNKGVKEAMGRGIQAGYPVEDVKVTLYDGSYHDIDSSEMAFKFAGSMGFRDGCREANPVILEPMMKVKVETPEDFMDDVIGDIAKRRGNVSGVDNRTGNKIVNAFVPLSEMFGYSADLRSMTQGRAIYAMEFDHYEEVPSNIAKEIIEGKAAYYEAHGNEIAISEDKDENNRKIEKQKVTSISEPVTSDVLEVKVANTTALGTKSRSGADDENNLDFITKRVYYGTDREEITKEKKTSYNSKRGSHVSYGYCEVSIPLDHRIGEIERPSIWKFEFKEKPEKHMVLLSTNILEKKIFFRTIYIDLLFRNKKAESFIFVHGFGVTFDEAARRTAQMAYDLEFDGVPLFYSWPSKGKLTPLAYTHDKNNVDWCFPHLEKFILEVARYTRSSYINLIAHSMGNHILTKALNNISESITHKTNIPIRQIVLTAPDIDTDTFKRDIVPKFKNFDARVTLYASSTDIALKVSKKVNGYKRAGDTGKDIVIEEGIDTVDATKVDTSFIGHSYYGDNRSVISDMYYLIKENKDPNNRFGLEDVSTNKGIYWQFRE